MYKLEVLKRFYFKTTVKYMYMISLYEEFSPIVCPMKKISWQKQKISKGKTINDLGVGPEEIKN